MDNQFNQLEKQLGIQFKDKQILTQAFIHRSYLNENLVVNRTSNERLEYLGDACLELAVSEYLYHTYPQEDEGTLTSYRSALVNTTSLAETAREINLGKYLLLSKGEEESGGRDSDYLLANTFEALLGAIYLTHGFKVVQDVLKKHLIPKITRIVATQSYKDAKSKLQELAQETMMVTPTYKVLDERGPDHDKNFEVGVFVGKKKIGAGQGSSKQKAEIVAAQNALENWEDRK